MAVHVKICGIKDQPALKAALEGGAHYIGYVFYENSKNNIPPKDAAQLSKGLPSALQKVGLFVDPTDHDLQHVLSVLSLDLIQLHGMETPQRVHDIRTLFHVPVMKALRLKTVEHFSEVAAYEPVVDRLLFDSRLGKEASGGTLDWELFAGRHFSKPWMLAGGLTAENVGEALRRSGARAVDVSSGVEDESGQKSPAKIRAFLDAAHHAGNA